MTRRLAFARIAQETNTLSPVETTLEDFRSTHYLAGEALRRALAPGGEEVPGMFRQAELGGFVEALSARRAEVEPVPLFSAWAVSSGPLTRAAFDALTDELVTRLRAAGPVDGVYLALHGAMGVRGVRDPEREIVLAARSVVGGAPVVASFDLHTNQTQERLAVCDAVLSFQTNPHRDHARVGRRAANLLTGMLLEGKRPVIGFRTLPMILGGGLTIDFLPPMLPLFLRLKWLERDPAVLAASINMCHPWNDHPALGWSTTVVTDGDSALAERLADDLAERCWARRHDEMPRFISASEAVARAHDARLARRLGAVVMTDLSDVVTAGAPGENTAILKALLAEGRGLLSYVPVRDPAAIEEIWSRPEGATVRVSVGGKLDPARGEAVLVEGRIQRKGRFHGFERMVVLAIGDVRLVLVEGPAIVMRPSFFEQVGLDVWKADVIVVKNFFPFLLFFAKVNRKTLLVRTSGVTDFDAARALTFDGPVHPFSRVDGWRETDRRRRGLGG